MTEQVKNCGTCRHFKAHKPNKLWAAYYEKNPKPGTCGFDFYLSVKRPKSIRKVGMQENAGVGCRVWAGKEV